MHIYTHVYTDTHMHMKVSERAIPYACKTPLHKTVSYVKII